MPEAKVVMVSGSREWTNEKAIFDPKPESRGTTQVIKEATKRGMPLRVVLGK